MHFDMAPARSKHMSLLNTSAPPSQATSLPSPPYSPPSSATGRVSFHSDNTARALKAARRQSSISYVSSRVNVYSRHAQAVPSTNAADPWIRTDMGGVWENSFQVEDAPATTTSRKVKRQTVGGLEDFCRVGEARAHVPIEGKSKTPLTLADKHADLLHAIAAAESRRLELQGQLATVEGELGELKRKWERIVNREPPHPTPDPHTSASVVDGLKESVRLLAAGLSDLSDITSATPAPASAMNTAERARDPQWPAQRQSDSSTSVLTGYGRRSISSVSSVWDGDTPSGIGGTGSEDGDLCLTRKGSDVSGARQAKVLRRRSRDVSHPPPAFTRHAASCSSTTTGVDLTVTSDIVHGITNSSTDMPVVAVSTSTSGICGRDVDGQGTPSKNAPLSKRPPSIILPPPSSMPGVGSLSMVSEAWGTVGRKLGGDVFSKGQKRASILLADVSQSIASALSPGPVATTPAPMPSGSSLYTPSSRSSPSPSTISLGTPISNASPPLARSKTLPRSGSWLEDDDDDMTTHAGHVMVPSMLKPTPAPYPIHAGPSSNFDDDHNDHNDDDDDDDDNDWNW